MEVQPRLNTVILSLGVTAILLDIKEVVLGVDRSFNQGFSPLWHKTGGEPMGLTLSGHGNKRLHHDLLGYLS